LGLITLLVFPLPAFFTLHYAQGISFQEFIQLDSIFQASTGIGIEFGIAYAFLALLILQAPIFKTIPLPIEQVIKNLNLNFVDIVFLSLCAGIGEELLFRVGVQHYLGIWITSILFVTIHGYFNPIKWKMSLYGLVVLPFIVLLSYGYEHFGLWFAIGAHFSYDFVLFRVMIEE
jgi:hypothetical protein